MDDETPAPRGRRAPWRFFNRGRATVESESDGAGHYETDPDSWADLPAETADQWDATCWFPVSGIPESFRPEFFRGPKTPPGGTR